MLERILMTISPTLLWPHWPFALLRPGCFRWMLVAKKLRTTLKLDHILILKKCCLHNLKYWRNSIGLSGNHASQGGSTTWFPFLRCRGNYAIRMARKLSNICATLCGIRKMCDFWGGVYTETSGGKNRIWMRRREIFIMWFRFKP